MALDVNNVVSVTVNISPKAASTRGFGQCLIIGTSNVIPKEERIRYYSSLTELGSDFTVDTDEYKMASVYFSQSPTPSQIAVGYWDNSQLGTKSIIQGGLIEDVKSLFVDGAMKFTYDSHTYDLNINCSSCTTIEQVISLLSEKFILQGTGTPFVPGTPQVDEVKNSISALGNLVDDGDDSDETITWSSCGTADTIILSLRDGTQIKNKDCSTAFASVNNVTTLETALNAGFTTANVTFNLLERDDTGKYYIKVTNNATVSDPEQNIVSLAFTGILEDKMGTQDGFDVVDYVPFKAEVPDKPAVPAVYFAEAKWKDDCIQIIPNEMQKSITLPEKSTEYPDVTDFSALMMLSTSTGGKVEDMTVYTESAEEIINILADKSQSWYACIFAETLLDQQIIDTSKIVEALSPVRIIGHTLQSLDEPTAKETVGSKLKDLSLKRTVCQYDPNSKYTIASYIAKLCGTNFNGNNTVITMKFKTEPTVEALDLSASEANYLTQKNINYYVKYSNDTAIIQQGTQMDGSWSDEVIGLDWLQNYLQTNVYNVFYTSTTKVPQTNQGVALIVAAVNTALERAKNNGLVAPGTWNGIGIGSLTTGSYLQNGYYTYAPDVSTQSQAERDARKAPSVQCAVKLGGAFHNADIIVNVER